MNKGQQYPPQTDGQPQTSHGCQDPPPQHNTIYTPLHPNPTNDNPQVGSGYPVQQFIPAQSNPQAGWAVGYNPAVQEVYAPSSPSQTNSTPTTNSIPQNICRRALTLCCFVLFAIVWILFKFYFGYQEYKQDKEYSKETVTTHIHYVYDNDEFDPFEKYNG